MIYNDTITTLTLMLKEITFAKRLLSFDKEKSYCHLMLASVDTLSLDKNIHLGNITLIKFLLDRLLDELASPKELTMSDLISLENCIRHSWSLEYEVIFKDPKLDKHTLKFYKDLTKTYLKTKTTS